MKLTFNQGEFILHGPFTFSKPLSSETWSMQKSNEFVTTSMKEALRFRQYADQVAEKVINRTLVKKYSLPPTGLPSFLDSHQREGVEWVLTRSRSYLAHAPGAGKTCQAIVAACLAPGDGQVVFIVPPSLTSNWVREIGIWTDRLDDGSLATRGWPSIAVVPESPNQEFMGWNAEFIIVPDSMLAKEWVLSKLIKMKKKFVAVDEASRFKEPTSLRTLALFGGKKDGLRSPGLIQEARHAVLLDGSPMPNRPMELWVPTIAMSPESIDFMDAQDFGFRYCGAKLNERGNWEFKYSSNENELKEKLQKDFMHVVPEERLSHPERRRSLLFMNQDPRTPEYKEWEKRFLKNADFSQIDEDMSQGELATRRRELGESKVPWAARYILERLKNKNESILVFAWHREVCIALCKALKEYNPGLIMGGVANSVRDNILRGFEEGKRKLIVANLLAAGRGNNVQRADRVIFVEWAWSDETNKQGEKRASRRGRDKELFVRCEYLVVPNSMDEPVLNAVFAKAKTTKRIIG